MQGPDGAPLEVQIRTTVCPLIFTFRILCSWNASFLLGTVEGLTVTFCVFEFNVVVVCEGYA